MVIQVIVITDKLIKFEKRAVGHGTVVNNDPRLIDSQLPQNQIIVVKVDNMISNNVNTPEADLLADKDRVHPPNKDSASGISFGFDEGRKLVNIIYVDTKILAVL